MKTIEEILKELSDNLKLKLLNGDYKILQIKKYENKIEIDGFVLHLHADVSYPEHAFGIYAGSILDTRFYNSDIMKGKNRIKIEKFFCCHNQLSFSSSSNSFLSALIFFCLSLFSLVSLYCFSFSL